MSETERFLATMTSQITDAEIALHNGNADPRTAMWSRNQPLTLLGAAMSARGWQEIGPVFDALGKQFSSCLSYENEIIAAEARGDLAYIVALEHTTASINGAEAKPYVLRVTTIFRREDGQWKVVHRHADPLSADSGAVVGRLSPPARDPQGRAERK
jgi:ketosteroid isomerase-like protein